jgi:6,7-dimethyl-8-ribityllumazine synthase
MAGPAPASHARLRRAGRARFAVVAARFNEPIVKKLVDGAVSALATGGVAAGAIDVHWVPGSFELPLAARHLAATGRYAGIACLGVVIRGETPHFEHVAREAAAGIRAVALGSGIPVTFGVITALTEEQAWARAGGPVGNRGAEAAEAALEMAEFVASAGRRPRPRARGGRRGGSPPAGRGRR